MNTRKVMRNLSTVYRQRRKAILRRLKEYDIGSGEWSVLTLFGKNGDGVEQTRIGEILGLDKTTVSRELLSLEKRGYLVRKQDERDKRKKIVYPTEKATEMIPYVRDAGRNWLMKIVEEIDKEEMKIFEKVLEELVDNAKHLMEKEQ